ncbi:MAG: hypothetical protein ACRD9L_21500, partial [Bryobacteraceae bacterium]
SFPSDKTDLAVCSYESHRTISSSSLPGVAFTIVKMSFGRRIELGRRVRDLGQKIEFLEAGEDLMERIEATVLAGEIDRLYLQWGLRDLSGLWLDGEPATPELLIDRGPEKLTREILESIKAECGVSDEERKN